MLTKEENDLITRTGPGTPAGELLRRYWQPVAVTDDLPPGGAPIDVRIMSEDLVLFRDHQGRPGLLGIHCSHRGADLSYGRVEDGGLRCLYHGWLYDVGGRCLEQPGEPSGSTFHERIRHTAYPCVEAGGLIFAYMGPGDPPLLPPFEFMTVPQEHRSASKEWRECNYWQALEGTLDLQHFLFLHRKLSPEEDPWAAYYRQDPELVMEGEATEDGARLIRLLKIAPDRYAVKEARYVVPNVTAIGARDGGYGGRWDVPIDDEHHWTYQVAFSRNALDPERRARRARGGLKGPEPRNRGNRYLQDREEMKTESFAGLGKSNLIEGNCALEAAPIQDRAREHLAYGDRGLMVARKVFIDAVLAVQEGLDPPGVVRDPARNRVPVTLVVENTIPRTPDWRPAVEALEREAEETERGWRTAAGLLPGSIG